MRFPGPTYLLIDTYETEGIKVISAWSMFRDDDLPVRPNGIDTRGRSFHEHMVHQCVSEDISFRTMLDIDVGVPPLPKEEVRLEFIRQYEEDSGKRLVVLGNKGEAWWEGETTYTTKCREAMPGGRKPLPPTTIAILLP